MARKTILTTLDGARSDALEKTDPSFLSELRKTTRYTMNNARGIVPSAILPVATSFFFGMPPKTHEVWANDFNVNEEGRYSISEFGRRQQKEDGIP